MVILQKKCCKSLYRVRALPEEICLGARIAGRILARLFISIFETSTGYGELRSRPFILAHRMLRKMDKPDWLFAPGGNETRGNAGR
jgi:hypothetical protein